MRWPVSRRQFIKQFSLVSSAIATQAMRPYSCPAIEPIQRTAGARIKLSLAAYSYERLFTGDNPTTMEEFVEDCSKMPLDGVELTSYYFPTPITPEYLRKLKGLAFRLGLDISGTAVGNDFCCPPGAKLDEQLALVKQWIDYAEVLDAPVIRIFAGAAQDANVDAAYKQAVEAIEECCQYAGEHGIYLALENHGGLTNTPSEMLRLVQAVDSPWFGVNLDTGNFHGEDIYGDLAKIAPYALNVQVKASVSGPDGVRSPSDFSKLSTILHDSGYRGYVVFEYEETGDPRKECPRYVEEMRKAFDR